MTVLPVGEPIFSERATVITIEDEAAGEYLRITQQNCSDKLIEQSITFDSEEWEGVKGVVDQMFKDIKDYQDEKP
jgi:hypothetical protein